MRISDLPERETSETQIKIKLNLDKGSKIKIDTDHGFLDHMLNSFARHSRFGLEVKAKGDDTGPHHLVEDVAIVLGDSLFGAAGDKKGIERFGYASCPMDEALAEASIDFGGRGFLVFDCPDVADVETGLGIPLIRDFFYALATHGKFNLHLKVNGGGAHHIIEACFKATAVALRRALAITGSDIPSTKGTLSD